MSHIIEDKNRRKLNLDTSKVSEILPEYFQSEYNSSSDITTFLEKYYDFLDSSGRQSFKAEINNLISVRDIDQTPEKYLDEIVSEIGDGLTQSSFFNNPRLMAKLLPLFYSSKGSKISAEGFFRGFFGEEVEVSYPKDSLLYVGGKDGSLSQGKIGYEDQLRIQDNALYQIFSILVRLGLSRNKFIDLYKKFVHPSGFFAGTQTLIQSNGIITFGTASENPVPPTPSVSFIGQATLGILGVPEPISGLVDSGERQYRINLNDRIDNYSDISIDDVNNFYGTIEKLIDANSVTFDNTTELNIDMSIITETMDNDMFTRYLSDSAI